MSSVLLTAVDCFSPNPVHPDNYNYYKSWYQKPPEKVNSSEEVISISVHHYIMFLSL